MALSGNKGEWSEIYALFRLLGEGKVHAGDADMNKLDLYYPILNVIREESKRYEYKPNTEQNVVVIDEDGREYARISMDRFMEESRNLLVQIKRNNKAAFSIPYTESFMSKVGCERIKAKSSDKADIHIIIHDFHTGMKPQLGFSIKSQLGSPSTLLNAGVPTNITYKVVGIDLTQAGIDKLNAIDEHLLRMDEMLKMGGSLEYHDIENSTFKNNLLFLDYCMPQLVADCLLAGNMPDSTSMIADTVKVVAAKNPLGFSGLDVLSFYAHKMKVLLLDTALGMTPAKEWLGKYDANGGYLVVRKDGEIVCYHFYKRNDGMKL